jgi:hypothetical protein
MEWRRATNLLVADFAAAITKRGWYALRWKIQIFDKVIKYSYRSGETRLDTSDRF